MIHCSKIIFYQNLVHVLQTDVWQKCVAVIDQMHRVCTIFKRKAVFKAENCTTSFLNVLGLQLFKLVTAMSSTLNVFHPSSFFPE